MKLLLLILLSGLTYNISYCCSYNYSLSINTFKLLQDLKPCNVLTVPVLDFIYLVCLIPTTIGGLLSAIGISGMDRLVKHNVIAISGRAVEAAGDIDVLLLDKTGTITLGNRMATEFIPDNDVPS